MSSVFLAVISKKGNYDGLTKVLLLCSGELKKKCDLECNYTYGERREQNPENVKYVRNCIPTAICKSTTTSGPTSSFPGLFSRQFFLLLLQQYV